VAALFKAALGRAQAAWQDVLPSPVVIRARLLDGTFLPGRQWLPHCALAVLELSTLGARALLEVELPPLAQLLALVCGDWEAGEGALQLTRAEETAFGYLLLRGLVAARAEEGLDALCSPRLLGVFSTRHDALTQLSLEPHVGIQFLLEMAGQTGAARLLVPARPLQAKLMTLPVEQSQTLAAEVRTAALPLRPRLGKTRMPPWNRALRVGDVVLLDSVGWREGKVFGEGRLLGPGFELRGELSPAGFTFFTVHTAACPEDSMLEDEVTAVHHLVDLPLEIEVELARFPLSLGALNGLRPGAILPLHIQLDEPVVLRVGDRAVARAELVELEGEVGARIIALLAD
jgi:type III secretion protein Q